MFGRLCRSQIINLLIIVGQTSDSTELCKKWKENANGDTCSQMSTDTSTNFYLTVLAYKSYVNGRLTLSGPNLKGIEEAGGGDRKKIWVIPFGYFYFLNFGTIVVWKICKARQGMSCES